MNSAHESWKWSLDGLAHEARKGELPGYLAGYLPLGIPDAQALENADAGRLEMILNAAGGEKRRLAKLLAASALLGEVPPSVRAVIRKALGNDGLEVLFRGRWRLAVIPCVQGTAPVAVHLLCGHFPVEQESDEWEDDELERVVRELFPQVPKAAAALELAKRKWGGRFFCRFPCASIPIAGTSLGLPVFLALGCAANDRPLPTTLLATGEVAFSGRLRPVNHVDRKMCLNMEHGMGHDMIAPVDNGHGLSADFRERIHLFDNIDDAWRFWEGTARGHSPRRISGLLQGLKAPARLFPLLNEAFSHELDLIAVPENERRLRDALSSSPSPGDGLRQLLTAIADSRSKEHREVRSLLVRLFDEPLVCRVAQSHPAVAWRLCMLHIRDCNHAGKPEQARHWLDLSRQWIAGLEDADMTEEMVSHALAVVSLLHNTYSFGEDPYRVVDPGFEDLFHGVLREYERRIKRGAPRRNTALGSWYGTLGQHHAFRGEWEAAEKHLDEALSYFEGDEDNLAQDHSYRFFVRLEAEKPGVVQYLLLCLGMEQLDGTVCDQISNLPRTRRPWALFALVRFLTAGNAARYPHVLSGLETLFRKWDEHGTLLGLALDRHPWQLISYNLGFLAPSRRLQARAWEHSARICLNPAQGPTVRVMALLPYSALYEHGHAPPPHISGIVEDIRSTIRQSSLNEDHFQAVLDAPDWVGVLELVAAQRRSLFPFNYR